MKVPRYKGSKDLLPEDMARFRHIEDVFRQSCLGWGYREVRTPTLEYLHLFTSAGTLTPGMLRRVYSFLDWDGWSGERVVLRPDGTIPTVRLYIDSMQEECPARLSYVSNMFAFEETGREARERWQGGAELVGSGKPMAELELIQLALEVLSRLNVGPVELRLSHAGLIRACLDEMGLTAEERSGLLPRLADGAGPLSDALQKQALRKSLSLLVGYKGRSQGFIKNIEASLGHVCPSLGGELEEFSRVTEVLDSAGVKYEIDIASARDFEYYTGTIFQFFVGDTKVGGGGRYDGLTPLLGGKKRPAAGFALYISRLIDMVKLNTPSSPVVEVEAEEHSPIKDSLKAVRLIQEAGFTARLNLGAKNGGRGVWRLQVNRAPPSFVLTAGKTKRKFDSMPDVLEWMRGNVTQAGAA